MDNSQAIIIPGYDIIGPVGSGRMGSVYRAVQKALDREVAIKVLRPELADKPKLAEHFLEEARAAAKLNHPFIVSGIDTGEYDGLRYFVMEFLPGGTLADYLKNNGLLDHEVALRMLEQMAQALIHAEERSIVHCDIKPANMMLDSSGSLKLTDLGLASLAMREESEEQRIVRGTPHYLSPEQLDHSATLDCRSDIYSLGASFYHMLSGRTPFSGDCAKEIALARLRTVPEPLCTVAPDLPENLCRLIDRMLSRSLDGRPKNSHDLLKKINKIKASRTKAEGHTAIAPAVKTEVEDKPKKKKKKKSGEQEPASPVFKVLVALAFAAALILSIYLTVIFS